MMLVPNIMSIFVGVLVLCWGRATRRWGTTSRFALVLGLALISVLVICM